MDAEKELAGSELLFFDPFPRVLPLYQALKEKLESRYPHMTLTISKTQISFRNRHIFAMVSLPWKRRKGWPQEYLLLSFGLARRLSSPRVAQATEPYPNRWTHHVIIERPEELDGELLEWLDEAYEFAANK